MKKLKKLLAPLVPMGDWALLPFVFPAALLLKFVRQVGLYRLPATRRVLKAVGVLPLRHHYYDPLVYKEDLFEPLDRERDIAGLDLDEAAQLDLLKRFDFADEFDAIPVERPPTGEFYYHNGGFESGDAQYLYGMIRLFKPKRIVEVGGGYSTMIAHLAVKRNAAENPAHACEHICVEPFENPWLEGLGVKIVRSLVQECPPSLFEKLDKNDILFIDTSHVIRPQGDVLHLYLKILGRLKSGVLVHAHDIFTPRDYSERSFFEYQHLWNEQYLLEAFLAFNPGFRVIGALNHLAHSHREALNKALPIMAQDTRFEPGSFWFIRN